MAASSLMGVASFMKPDMQNIAATRAWAVQSAMRSGFPVEAGRGERGSAVVWAIDMGTSRAAGCDAATSWPKAYREKTGIVLINMFS